ncbi:hypothetical protein GNF85_13705 [Clostridium perfringens]
MKRKFIRLFSCVSLMSVLVGTNVFASEISMNKIGASNQDSIFLTFDGKKTFCCTWLSW